MYTKQDTLIYLNKIKSKGFKTKTAEKATKILKDSVSQEQAVKMMRLAFGPTSDVLSKMNSIVKEYYSEIV